MKNKRFKCPECGSTKFEHVWPKDKKTPVFMVRCLKCSNYKGWINKQYAQQWKEGLVGMEVIHKILN